METIISTISHRPNLLPLLSADFLFFLFLLQLLQPTQEANSTAVSTSGFRSSSPIQPSPPRQVVRYPSPGSSSSPWKFHCFEQWNVNYNSRSTVHKWTVDVNYNSRSLFQWTLGRTSSGPAQTAGLGPVRPLKNKKLLKIISKNYDFLKYFSINFA
jgi:hypothetical protein